VLKRLVFDPYRASDLPELAIDPFFLQVLREVDFVKRVLRDGIQWNVGGAFDLMQSISGSCPYSLVMRRCGAVSKTKMWHRRPARSGRRAELYSGVMHAASAPRFCWELIDV